jgi:LysR family transcriptional regulator, nitrogen assimilation regulatory protein
MRLNYHCYSFILEQQHRRRLRLEARVLEFFLRVVEHGSINRAAEGLRLSQPSLSRWLTLLEREIGAQLLIRTRRGVRLTDAGSLLVERVRPILRQLDLLREEIGEKGQTTLTIGMPLSMQRVVTVPFVEQISTAQSNVNLRVHEGINNALRKWMEEGVLDLAIMTNLEHAPASFETTPLVREQLILVGDRHSKLRMDTAVPLSRLGIADMILPGRPNVIRSYVENAVTRAGQSYRTRIEAETLSLCLELTRRGLGYTVMPYCALHGRLDRATELRGAPISGLTLSWDLCINRTRVHAVIVRAVAAALRKFVAAQVQSGEWPRAEFTGHSA